MNTDNNAVLPENNSSIDERAAKAALSREEADKFIGDFKPYLINITKKLSQSNAPHEFDERLSNAMLAFYEAIRCYDIEKGHFLPFAGMIIKRRFSDKIKAEYRNEKNILSTHLDYGFYSAGDERESDYSPLLVKASVESYDRTERQNMLVLEIEQFSKELALWDITFGDLVKNAPKHAALKDEYKNFASKILQEDEIIATITKKKYYPVKKISEILQIPIKKVERTRTYIISVILIKKGNYEYLSGYLDF